MRIRALALPAAAVLLIAFRTAPGMAQLAGSPLPQRFEINPAHSQVSFSVRFMGLSNVRGAFATFEGSILYFADQPELSSVSVVILARSINTNAADRDRHLRSPDFLDVERYPHITFRSTIVRRSPSGLIADGQFTLHGVTRRISLPFTMLNPPVADAWGNARMTLQSQYRLDRKEYGVLGTAFWNSEFDPGRMAVGDDVEIDLLVSAIVPNVGRWADPFGDSLLAEVRRRGVPATVAQLRAAIAGNPRLDSLSDFPFMMAAEKLRASGQGRDAAALYDAFIALRPRSQGIFLGAGETYLLLGDTSRARAIFENVRRIDSTNTAASEWLRFLASRRR